MYNLKMFTTREELRQLTGLPSDNYDKALWDNGFDLDDWDVGFESDKPLEHIYGTEPNENLEEDYDDSCYCHEDIEIDFSCPNDDAYWLVNRMDNYCCGYNCTKYNGKYYYLVYHS